MKDSYLVKYGVLEVKEYYNGYNYYTLGFIASKCYVVEEVVKYHEDKRTTKTYGVVFPYDDISEYESNIKAGLEPYLGIEVYPEGKQSYTVSFVSNVYNTFEEAKQEAEFLNNRMLGISLRKLDSITSQDEEYYELKEDFLNNMNRCERFENEIRNETKYPKIDNVKKLKLSK